MSGTRSRRLSGESDYPTPHIVFITVQYNNPSDTERLVRSLWQLDDSENCSLIVVDNSREKPDSILDSPWPLKTLRPNANLYYWGGAAYALEWLESQNESWPAWVVVCNNDIIIEDSAFIRTIRTLDPRKYPIVAPRITSLTTGKEQNPILGSPPGLLKRLKWRTYDLNYRVARTLLALHVGATRLLGRLSNGRQRPNQAQLPREIYAPHGACVIFSSAFFRRGGALDTTVPLFAEELTVASSAEKLGLAVSYQPDLQVFHREHSTTGIDLTPEKYEMERSARRHYYRILRSDSSVANTPTRGSAREG